MLNMFDRSGSRQKAVAAEWFSRQINQMHHLTGSVSQTRCEEQFLSSSVLEKQCAFLLASYISSAKTNSSQVADLGQLEKS